MIGSSSGSYTLQFDRPMGIAGAYLYRNRRLEDLQVKRESESAATLQTKTSSTCVGVERSKIEDASLTPSSVCSRCGSQLLPNARYCTVCGAERTYPRQV